MVFYPDTVINSLIHANIIYYNCTYFTIRMNRKAIQRQPGQNLNTSRCRPCPSLSIWPRRLATLPNSMLFWVS